MKNLKELQEKYSKYPHGLGHIRWGGKSYYEINSDVPLNLNNSGREFILNEKGEVELFDLNRKVLSKRHYYLDELWEDEVDYETDYFWDEYDCLSWWGKTLDNYYPWSWYPEKDIIAFEITNDIPFNPTGGVLEVVGGTNEGWIELRTSDGSFTLTVRDCLACPEFFKPVYEK